MIRARKEPLLSSKLDAFPYQLETIQAIEEMEYAGIFHEQGLGKTKIAIDLALTWLRQSAVDSVLIITKKGLVRNWQDELLSHCHVQPRILLQDANSLHYALNSPSRIYLTHYEVCRSEEKLLQLFLKTRRVGVICDESHKIKNPDSALAKSLHRLSEGFTKRVIMTGTPIANRPYDIWSQIFFLDQGRSLGTDFSQFRSSFDLPDSAAVGTDFVDHLGHLHSRLGAFTVRKTKESSKLDLPSKAITDIPVALETAQRDLYELYRTQLSAEVTQGGLTTIDNAEEVLKRLLRLVQVSSNPLLVDEAYTGTPGKLPKLLEILSTASSGGKKAIVWTSFTKNADWLCCRLSDFGATKVHGKLSIDDRNKSIARFKEDESCRVLVATPGAAKEGLTLTVANFAIFYDRSFSLDDYLQAQDRIHRISQTTHCHIFNLIATPGIDEWVSSLLAAKHLAAQLGQGDIEKDHFASKMTYAYLDMLQDVLNIPVPSLQPLNN